MIETRIAYAIVVGLEALERGWELVLSARNSKVTIAGGGVESGRAEHLTVTAIHIVWLTACVAEVWLCNRPFVLELAIPCALVLMLAMALRYWAISTLGSRWNLRIITIPQQAPVNGGPYRYLNHPNYVALYLELFALPLLHSAWLTAVLIAPAHAAAVYLKARAEDRALGRLQ